MLGVAIYILQEVLSLIATDTATVSAGLPSMVTVAGFPRSLHVTFRNTITIFYA